LFTQVRVYASPMQRNPETACLGSVLLWCRYRALGVTVVVCLEQCAADSSAEGEQGAMWPGPASGLFAEGADTLESRTLPQTFSRVETSSPVVQACR
jgi:hypothetical protein